jgi:hypothetical protein
MLAVLIVCLPTARVSAVSARGAGTFAVSVIDVPGSTLTAATGIATGRHGFLRSAGNFSTFEVPGASDFFEPPRPTDHPLADRGRG